MVQTPGAHRVVSSYTSVTVLSTGFHAALGLAANVFGGSMLAAGACHETPPSMERREQMVRLKYWAPLEFARPLM
jgi:hypothetical protein